MITKRTLILLALLMALAGFGYADLWSFVTHNPDGGALVATLIVGIAIMLYVAWAEFPRDGGDK